MPWTTAPTAVLTEPRMARGGPLEPNLGPGLPGQNNNKLRGASGEAEFRFWKTPNAKGQRYAFNRALAFGEHGISNEEFRALQADSEHCWRVPGGSPTVVSISFTGNSKIGFSCAEVVQDLPAAYGGITGLSRVADHAAGDYSLNWTGENPHGEGRHHNGFRAAGCFSLSVGTSHKGVQQALEGQPRSIPKR